MGATERVVLPWRFEECSRGDLLVLISRMLEFLMEINDSGAAEGTGKTDHDEVSLTRFHSKAPPDITIYLYFTRLARYSALESCVLLTAVYYIDLLSSVYPAFALNSLTAHRFILTATTVASKGLCDNFCTNAHYARVGGVQCDELNVLESEFLKRVNYRIIPRDHAIAWCKWEHRLRAQGTSLPTPPSYNQTENSGYNVLSMYYRKIVQLVGTFGASPDKSRKVDYILQSQKRTSSHLEETFVAKKPTMEKVEGT